MRDDFLPHQLNLFEESDLKLYHVYDGLSQAPYCPGCGIQSGDINVYWMRYWHRMIVNALAKHLDWYQREPISFISPYEDAQAASYEAQRRVSHPYVYDRKTKERQHRGIVQIAVMSATRLSREGVFFFSTRDLMSDRMLNRSRNHSLYSSLNAKE
jgi:hypothetical protein